MSNPSDPKPTPPDQPDPNAAKPGETPPGDGREPTGRSSFEFKLPDDVGSYGDLPPLPQPEAIDTTMSHAALPPRPAATRPATGTFDFIDLPDVDPALLAAPGGPKPPPLTPTDPAVSLPPVPAPEPPLLTPTDNAIALPPEAVPAAGDSAVTLGDALPTAEPLSSFTLSAEALDLGTLPEVPTADPASGSSVPDIATLSLPPDPPSSFVLGQVMPPAPAAPAEPDSFVLPAPPALGQPSTPELELPPQPGAFGAPAVADFELPTSLPDPEAAVGNPEPVDPISPASGWLDSDVLSIPTAPGALVPTAEPFEPAPADAVESSDIFSGARGGPALPVEQSDVIVATAYGPAPPTGAARPRDVPARPSDVALTFDGPPGGSTLDEGASDLPVADEVADSGNLLAGPVEAESIHDMPDPASADPLFDSARLAGAPDLPSSTRVDAPDFGAPPTYSADASSILADLSEPPHPAGTDSSSVRVEAPGVDRTLTNPGAADAFDLTVSDEPIPADLFDAPSDDATATEATDWQQQSGSDLFAEGATAPDIDFADAGRVEPVDADLGSEQPSLTSAPSSIFSGNNPPPAGSGSAITGGSADVKIGAPEPSGDRTDDELIEFSEAELAAFADADADAAEFSPHPALDDTAERQKDLPPAVPPKKPSRQPSSGDFELPPTPAAADADDGGAIDWDAAGLSDDDNATRGIPKDASLSAILRGLDDPGTRDAAPLPPGGGAEDEPVVSIDWLASSAEGTAITEAQAKGSPAKPKDKKDDRGQKEAAKPAAKKPDVREPEVEAAPAPKAKKGKPSRPVVSDGAEVATEDAGERAKGKPAKPVRKGGGMLVGVLLGGLLAGGAAAGAYFAGLVPNGEKPATAAKPPTGDNPGQAGGQQPPAAADPQATFAAGGTAAALEQLKTRPPATTEEKAASGFVRVFAKVQELGKANAATAPADDADLKAARADLEAVLADADAAKTPEGERRAVAATVQLGVSYEVAGDAAAARKVFADGMAKFPKHAAVFEALVDRLDAAKDPGTSFVAPRLTPEDARRLLFAATILLADDAPKAEDDPEPGLYYWKAVNQAAAGKYAAAVKLISEAKAAHVKRAKALAGRGLNPLTDPLEQMFPRSCDELAAYWKLRDEMYKNPAVAAAIKKDGLPKTLDAFVKAQADLAKTQTDLTTAKADLAKAEKAATTLADDVKAAQKAKTEVEDKLKTAAEDLKAAQKDAKERGDVIAAVGEALKPAKVLPEKWTPADLVAGAKQAAGLAGGIDAQRLVKAETAAKEARKAQEEAEKKLVAETKAITAKYEGDIKKLTDDGAAELKKAADKYAADAKKLTDEHAADLKKLKDESATAVKAEQEKTEAEKKAAAAKEIAFQKQLANAVTPTQAMDLWLPVLTDLRRPSDAPAALAVAARALASSTPNSEDEAKAHTVKGMALLLQGDLPGARDEFQAARRGPAYAAAKGKAWARAADAGLDAIDDPLAPYRQPVVIPPVDLRAAAKALDAGILAYKARNHKAAAALLADAAKNDPADPVAWYYLGAARWALGDAKQAEKDFGQGAEREKASPLPGRVLSEALAPIQGAARDAIDKARP
jgi:hypothetical protein